MLEKNLHPSFINFFHLANEKAENAIKKAFLKKFSAFF